LYGVDGLLLAFDAALADAALAAGIRQGVNLSAAMGAAASKPVAGLGASAG
jgi:hypothetical protein